MIKFIKAVFILGAMSLAGTAAAIPISGSISFSEIPGATWAGIDTNMDASQYEAITFSPSSDNAEVDGATGVYTGTETTPVTFKDFTIGDFPAQLWTFDVGSTTYSFSMNTLTTNIQVLGGPTESIILMGSGTAFIDDGLNTYDPSGGQWTLNLSSAGGTFSFSSGAVPAPGIALLLGMGLLGIGIARKMRKT